MRKIGFFEEWKFKHVGFGEIKNKIFLEEGVPSYAPARRRRRSCAITPCCPPLVKAGITITFANVLAAALANCR